MKKKRINLQPWLDYFDMLKRYVECGYLETKAEKNEAYITQSALLTLANADSQPSGEVHKEALRRLRAYAGIVRNIRAYAAWKIRRGYDYLREPFALNIVKDDTPHDLTATILVSYRRRWWRPWKRETIEVITYEK